MDALLVTAIEQPRVAALPTFPCELSTQATRAFQRPELSGGQMIPAPITFSTSLVSSTSVSLHIISLPAYPFESARGYHKPVLCLPPFRSL